MPIIETTGGPDSRVVVFVHGSPGDHRLWRRVAERAPADVMLAFVDLPDHGAGEDAPSSTYADCENDVIEAARRYGDRPTTLVGHSLGAYLVARVCAGLADFVDRVVMISGFDELPGELAAGRAEFADAIERGDLSAAAVKELASKAFLGENADPEVLELVDSWVSTGYPGRFVRSLRRASQAATAEARVGPYDTRAIVIHELRDPAVPFALGERLARLGSRAEIVAIEGQTHLTPLIHDEEVARWIYDARP